MSVLLVRAGLEKKPLLQHQTNKGSLATERSNISSGILRGTFPLATFYQQSFGKSYESKAITFKWSHWIRS